MYVSDVDTNASRLFLLLIFQTGNFSGTQQEDTIFLAAVTSLYRGGGRFKTCRPLNTTIAPTVEVAR